jgi:hypothetical protein
LRRIADSDGEGVAPLVDTPVDCAALQATCAHESTGAATVVRALQRAASDWLADGDVKRLRLALLGVVAKLDQLLKWGAPLWL